MSLDQYPILTDRRFQPSERSSYDTISMTSTQWNYPPRSQNEIPHDYTTNSSQWNVNLLNNHWSTDVIPSPSSSFSSAAPSLRSSTAAYPNQYAYQEHSQSSSSPSISTALPSSFERAVQHRSPSTSSTFKFDDASWAPNLYTINDRNTPSHSLPPTTTRTSPSARALSSSRTTSSRSPPVKLESDELSSADCFVMEFATSVPAAQDSTSLAPPTEVPLRATQASKAMRKMMGVFRLNPFSMHEGGGQAMSTWIGEEAGPLEEEPKIFEFQLDIGYLESDEEGEEQVPQQLQTVAEVPEPELHENTRWAEGHELELSYPPVSSWATNESAYSSYTLPSLKSYASHSHSPSLSSASSRKTPSASDYPGMYTLHGAGSCGSSTDNLPSLSSMARRWAIPANLQAPFMI
ncbi:hypothetical protein K503DRAFT_863710 [Rhizopogon vinicolor AM-OR11-026]|uniref:Uncharacterized protein n=1 Tax=Rhizopogon vinicolor AM-OR11-026 TaxID=1314800 RepID=A0A1B7N9V2_9AGAM|nr:hypothetical protein K503DRAFT_863710 [Rhizopogon vinicolor AM-OR11-026]